MHRIGRTGRAGASGLAVTLVTRDDARLVGDIEKLIKKTLEIEPIELEDDRPRRPPPRRRDDEFAERVAPAPERSFDRPYEAPRRAAAQRDPFFDRPYEASSGAPAATWEAVPKAAATSSAMSRGLSPNIRPKKKVASLLGGS